MAVTTTLLDLFKLEEKNWIKEGSGVALPAYAVIEINDDAFEVVPITMYRESDEDTIYVQFRGIYTNYEVDDSVIDLIYITGSSSTWKPATSEEVDTWFNGDLTPEAREARAFVKIELTLTDIQTIVTDQPYAILIKFTC